MLVVVVVVVMMLVVVGVARARQLVRGSRIDFHGWWFGRVVDDQRIRELHVRVYWSVVIRASLTSQLDLGELKQVAGAGGMSAGGTCLRTQACLNGMVVVVLIPMQDPSKASATDARGDMYVPHHPSGGPAEENRDSPKTKLLRRCVDDVDAQRSVAGGAVQRVEGAGGGLAEVSTDACLALMRASGFNMINV